MIGNHDLHNRHTREIYSPIHFNEFKNFTVYSEPTVIDLHDVPVLMCPFIFPTEYDSLTKYNHLKLWFGHFEFKDFIITGHSMKMMHGPDASIFNGPSFIFSGHYHKRQHTKNVMYVGNVFPTSFADANDSDRGCVIYDFDTNTTTPINWSECPKYQRVMLSDILNGCSLESNARVKCIADVQISYEESIQLKQNLTSTYNLREFNIEESPDIRTALADTQISEDTDELLIDLHTDNCTMDELIIKMLRQVNIAQIETDNLVSLYQSLHTN
jgi:DNA repair exonuclease SbcCD nuclease subunit